MRCLPGLSVLICRVAENCGEADSEHQAFAHLAQRNLGPQADNGQKIQNVEREIELLTEMSLQGSAADRRTTGSCHLQDLQLPHHL